MAPLKIIGAGQGRTGTESLKNALNILGYSCHHMREFIKRDGHPELFQEAYEHPERNIDWDFLYDGYDAAVDEPTSAFVEPLLKKYPDAKVILTYRDPDSWYKSVANSIQHVVNNVLKDTGIEYIDRMYSMIATINPDIVDPVKFKDEEAVKAKYVERIERIKRVVPADKLLVLDLGEGWDRLCAFLDKPIPEEPYPRGNSTEDVKNMVANTDKIFAQAKTFSK